MRSEKINFKIQQKKGERGFSLVEIVISLLVLTIVFGGLLNLMVNFSVGRAVEQTRRTAVSAAKELMEEIKSKKFDQLTNQDPTTGWSALGIDTGETGGSKATFNDVDDYHNLTESLSAPFAGYNRMTTVTYVSSADLATASVSRLNDYKRVTVQVFKGGVLYAQLVTVVSAAVVPS